MSKPKFFGRPTKYKPKFVERILQSIARGNTLDLACTANGICRQTLHNFRQKYPEFDEQVETALALVADRCNAIIDKAIESGDVATAKWRLEHNFPKQYAKSRIEITGANGQPLPVNPSNIIVNFVMSPKEPLREWREPEPPKLLENQNGNRS